MKGKGDKVIRLNSLKIISKFKKSHLKTVLFQHKLLV